MQQLIHDAMYFSLQALVRLSTRNKNKTNSHIVENIIELWNKTKRIYKTHSKIAAKKGELPPLSILLKAERNLRKYYIELLRIRIQNFGYTMGRRIRNEYQGNVDHLNRIYNIAGSELRTKFDIYFPVLDLKGSDFMKEVVHKNLIFLDFAEMLRPHLMDLGTVMLLHNVPYKEMNGYFSLFFHRARPAIRWIYIGGGRGRRYKIQYRDLDKYIIEHPRDLDQILNKTKKEIKKKYSTLGRKTSVTSDESDYPLPVYYSKEVEIKKFRFYHGIPLKYKEIANEDFIRMIDNTTTTKQRISGSNFHELLLSGYPQPFSLEEVILDPDTYCTIFKEIAILTEIDISTPEFIAKADILVCIREGNTLIPILIVDLKTRFQYIHEIGEKSSRNDPTRKIPSLNSSHESLSGKLRLDYLSQPPTLSEKEQLDKYKKAVEYNYNAITGSKCNVATAIFRIPADEDLNNVEIYRKLLLQAIKRIVTSNELLTNLYRLISVNKSVYSEIQEYERPSIGMHIHRPLEKPVSYSKFKIQTISNIPTFNFSSTNTGKKILYQSHVMKSPGGEKAAWTAMLYDVVSRAKRRFRTRKILILDLMGIFIMFRKERFAEIPFLQSTWTNEDDQSIEIESWPNFFEDHKLHPIEQKKRIIIILGWDEYQSLPYDYSVFDKFKLKEQLIKCLPEDSVVYFTETTPRGSFSSKYYKDRAINRISQSKKLEQFNEVIFNLATPPRSIKDYKPQFDDQRIIVELKENQITVDNRTIPPLNRHYSKYRSGFKLIEKSDKNKFHNLTAKTQAKIIGKALDLLPELHACLLHDSYTKHLLIKDIEFSNIVDVLKNSETELPCRTKIYPQNNSLRPNFQYENGRRFYYNNVKIMFPEGLDYLHPPRVLQRDYPIPDDLGTTTSPISLSLLEFNVSNKPNTQSLDEKTSRRLSFMVKRCHDYLSENKYYDIHISELFYLIEAVHEKSDRSSDYLDNLVFQLENNVFGNLNSIWSYYKDINSEFTNSKNHMTESLNKYGIYHFVLIATLDAIYPGHTVMELKRIFQRLLSYTLQTLGYQPKIRLPATAFNYTIISNSISKLFKDKHSIPSQKYIPLELLEGVLSEGVDFSWVLFEGYDPLLLKNRARRKLFTEQLKSYNRTYHPIYDKSIVQKEHDKLESYEKHYSSIPILLKPMYGKKYLWIWSGQAWQNYGTVEIYLDPKSTNRISKLKINHTNSLFEKIEYDPNITIDLIEYLTQFNEFVSYQTLKWNLRVNDTVIFSPKIHIEFVSEDNEIIWKEAYDVTEDLIARLQGINSVPISPNDMSVKKENIPYDKKFLVSGMIENGFEVIWGDDELSLQFIQRLIEQRVDIPYPGTVLELLEYAEKMQNASIVTFKLSHLEVSCIACKASVKRIEHEFVKYSKFWFQWMKSPNRLRHGDYFRNEVFLLEQTSDKTVNSESIKQLIGLNSSQAIYDTFIHEYSIHHGEYKLVLDDFETLENTLEYYFVAEDYNLQKLANERYGRKIKNKMPGSFKLPPVIKIEELHETDGGLYMRINRHDWGGITPRKDSVRLPSGDLTHYDCRLANARKEGLEKVKFYINDLANDQLEVDPQDFTVYKDLKKLVENHISTCINHYEGEEIFERYLGDIIREEDRIIFKLTDDQSQPFSEEYWSFSKSACDGIYRTLKSFFSEKSSTSPLSDYFRHEILKIEDGIEVVNLTEANIGKIFNRILDHYLEYIIQETSDLSVKEKVAKEKRLVAQLKELQDLFEHYRL